MNNKNTGGPAFPSIERDQISEQIHDQHQGMSLRDHFAAQALGTVAAYPTEGVVTWGYHDFAKHAYGIADAMLAERAK